MTDQDGIDMTEALRRLGEATRMCEELHGKPLNREKPNDKSQQARNARRSRDLQYLSHIVGAARVAVDEQFHRFKGDLP